MSNGFFQKSMFYLSKNTPYLNYFTKVDNQSTKTKEDIEKQKVFENTELKQIVKTHPTKTNPKKNIDYLLQGAKICIREVNDGIDVYEIAFINQSIVIKNKNLLKNMMISKQIVEEIIKTQTRVVVLNSTNEIIAKNFI